MAAIVLTRKPRNDAVLVERQLGFGDVVARLRVGQERLGARQIHLTGRPVSLEASSTSGISLKIGDFMPNSRRCRR